MSTPCPLLLWLDGLGPALAGPNTDHVLDRGDEDLPVPDPPGARTADDRIDDFRHALIRDQHGDLHLGQEIDDVLRAAVELRVTLLPPESLHLLDGHAVDSGFREDLLHLVELERFDDRVDAVHRSPFVAVRRSRGSSNGDATPPTGGVYFSLRVEPFADHPRAGCGNSRCRLRVRAHPLGGAACSLRSGSPRSRRARYSAFSSTPISPRRRAYSVRPTRSRTSSLWKTLLMCVFTVASSIESRRAISSLWKPRPMSRTISRSRVVSAFGSGSGSWAGISGWSVGGSPTGPSAVVRTASISVSTANRLKTTARAPDRMAVRASESCWLAVTT